MEKYNFYIEPLLQDFPQIEKLSFYLSTELSANNIDHRLQLRSQIYNKLFVEDLPSWLTDLEELPETKTHHISISHCPQKSGFACIPKPHRLGIDIEARARITPKLIDRISSPAEQKGLLTPSLLWPAKEAAWKACQAILELEVMSQIETYAWREIKPKTISFKVQINGEKIDGIGLCVLEEDTLLAFYTFDSTFSRNNRRKY